MSTVLTTWQLARTIASRVAQSAEIADIARELCGQPLTVYLDGLPADRRGIAASYPALVVTAQSGGEPLGGAVGARGRHVDMIIRSHGALFSREARANNAGHGGMEHIRTR